MRFQFSLIRLLQIVTVIGLTLGLDLWLVENRAAVLILIAWSGLIGAFLAVRSFHNIGAPANGGIALVIAAVIMFTNGVALAFVAPGVVLPPSPSNPFPLKNLDYFELGRTVLITTLTAGIVGSVFGLIAGAVLGAAHSDARKQ
jgi:hypothetical protein